MTTTRARSPGSLMTCALALVAVLSTTGCATQDIPPAHKGRVFGRTGLFALYTGGSGFVGPVQGPGTQFLGLYNELRMVDCSMSNASEELDTLTRDGVHFGLKISVRFAADCSDEAVVHTLVSVAPAEGEAIRPGQLYATFMRPAIGESVRELISPYRANELNDKQAEVTAGIRKRFLELMATREKKIVIVHEVNISDLHFPSAMDTANLERAVQAVLRDKAVAERERVQAEIETTKIRRELVEKESEVAAVRILRIGEMLKRYPEYMQYEFQQRLPEIYREAGGRGNLILGVPNPIMMGPTAGQVPQAPQAPQLPNQIRIQPAPPSR